MHGHLTSLCILRIGLHCVLNPQVGILLGIILGMCFLFLSPMLSTTEFIFENEHIRS